MNKTEKILDALKLVKRDINTALLYKRINKSTAIDLDNDIDRTIDIIYNKER